MKKHKKPYVLKIETKDKIIRIESPSKVKIVNNGDRYTLEVKDKKGIWHYVGYKFFINDIECIASKVHDAMKNKEEIVYVDIYYSNSMFSV